MPSILLLFISSLLLVGCGGSKYKDFFNVATEQMRNGYEWQYTGRIDAIKEQIEYYIPMYKGSNNEEYIYFQLHKP